MREPIYSNSSLVTPPPNSIRAYPLSPFSTTFTQGFTPDIGVESATFITGTLMGPVANVPPPLYSNVWLALLSRNSGVDATMGLATDSGAVIASGDNFSNEVLLSGPWPSDFISSVTPSPDGSHALVLYYPDNTGVRSVTVVRVSDGSILSTVSDVTGFWGIGDIVAWKDNTTFAAVMNGNSENSISDSIEIYDLSGTFIIGIQLPTAPDAGSQFRSINSIKFSPDGTKLAVCYQYGFIPEINDNNKVSSIYIYETTSWSGITILYPRPVNLTPPNTSPAVTYGVAYSMMWSLDSTLLAVFGEDHVASNASFTVDSTWIDIYNSTNFTLQHRIEQEIGHSYSPSYFNEGENAIYFDDYNQSEDTDTFSGVMSVAPYSALPERTVPEGYPSWYNVYLRFGWRV